MYVCLCKGITDSQIETAVENGATSFRAVRDQLGVSTCCGKCSRLARDVVRRALEDDATAGGTAPESALLFYPATGAQPAC